MGSVRQACARAIGALTRGIEQARLQADLNAGRGPYSLDRSSFDLQRLLKPEATPEAEAALDIEYARARFTPLPEPLYLLYGAWAMVGGAVPAWRRHAFGHLGYFSPYVSYSHIYDAEVRFQYGGDVFVAYPKRNACFTTLGRESFASFSQPEPEIVRALGHRWRERDRLTLQRAVEAGLVLSEENVQTWRARQSQYETRPVAPQPYQGFEAVTSLLVEGGKPVAVLKDFGSQERGLGGSPTEIQLYDQVMALLHYQGVIEQAQATHPGTIPLRTARIMEVGGDYLIREYIPEEGFRLTVGDRQRLGAMAAAFDQTPSPEAQMITFFLTHEARWNCRAFGDRAQHIARSPDPTQENFVMFDPV